VIRRAAEAAHRSYADRRYRVGSGQSSDSPFVRSLGRVGRRAVAGETFFLHIPKTGGTAMRRAVGALSREQRDALGIVRAPRYLSHRQSFQAFRDPNLRAGRFVFTFREPTDRYVAGFYEALRQGRPYSALGREPWSSGNFAAFLWFKEPNDLFEALGSAEDRFVSAAVTAFNEILHLRWDHVRMLGTVPDMRTQLRRIRHFCPVEKLETDFVEFFDLRPDADTAGLQALITRTRSAPVQPPPVSDEGLTNLRRFKEHEYRLHEFLVDAYEKTGGA
jgi:hypothetical protein